MLNNPTSPARANDDRSLPSERYLELKEDLLLADCRFEAFRGSGPGGQKRNKTSSCIRLTHIPTGLHVLAGESRSQAENKARAVRRLKLKLATEIRYPIDSQRFEPPDWFSAVTQLGRLSISHHNEHYARTASLVLDLLDGRRGNLADVATLLGVSTSSVVKFLADEPQLLTAANQIRKAWRQKPLEARR